MTLYKTTAFLGLCTVCLFSRDSWGASNLTKTSKQFQQIFTTAGYSSVLGAALGGAVVGLSKEPKQNLRFIALGASIGFISGSLLGGYFAFRPTILHKNHNHPLDYSLAPPTSQTPTLTIEPIVDLNNMRPQAWKATFLLARL